jgi:predicted RNA-binding Zn ribbon-like protein
MTSYTGPLRDEPLALELHNTLYAAAGAAVDALADAGAARAWLDAIAPRLPAGGEGESPTADALAELREPVRDVVSALIAGTPAARASIEALNAFSARAPAARVARWRRGAPASLALDFAGAPRSDVVLAALAADALELLCGPERDEIRACGAPGCVLAYLRGGTRREWCCAACGNRARQARHYARSRAGQGPSR